jgi:serine/threonine protein kinase
MGNVPNSGEDAYNITLNKENKLGEGAFARVYKIERKFDEQLCAAKILKISMGNMIPKEEKGCEREL